MASQAVRITESDLRKVAALLAEERRWPAVDRLGWRALAERVERAGVLPDEEVPGDLVTLRSRVRVADVDSGFEATYLLVMPVQASSIPGLISVSSPMGAALLGCREGDETEFHVPGGLRRLRIERVLSQPEAAARRASATAAARVSSATGRPRQVRSSSSLGSRVARDPESGGQERGSRRP